MSVVVTVMNMKGGVGKTTTCMHLAGIFSRYKIGGRPWRVLAIDYDPQFNLSQSFIPVKKYFELEKEHKTCLSILTDLEENIDPFEIQVPGNPKPPSVKSLAHSVYRYSESCLDVIPSTLSLMFIALGQSEKRLKPLEERFETFIDECKTKYDIIFIDCHPAGSILTKTSLHNSDHVIIPVSLNNVYAQRGIGLMLQFIRAKKLGRKAPTPHILFNFTRRYGGSSEEDSIRDQPDLASLCMETTLNFYSVFSEPSGGLGFAWSSPKPYSRQATANLREVARDFGERAGILPK